MRKPFGRCDLQLTITNEIILDSREPPIRGLPELPDCSSQPALRHQLRLGLSQTGD